MSQKEIQRRTGRRAGRGSHGSLVKSGKVRDTTPQIPKTSTKKSPIPRRHNHLKYLKRIVRRGKKNDKMRDENAE